MNQQEPAIFYINTYTGNYLPFYPHPDADWLKQIELNWEKIRAELMNNEGFNEMVSPLNLSGDGWKSIYLLHYGWIRHQFAKDFPETMKLLYLVPDLTFSAFSMLEPGASLAPHYGFTNTTIRYHLGIEIPASAPVCALQVQNEVRGWEQGKAIVFSECHLHTAWNKSDKRRIILAFDTLRPEFSSQRRYILTRILAEETLAFLKYNFSWFNSIPKIIHTILYWLFAACWFVYLPLQKGWKNLKSS